MEGCPPPGPRPFAPALATFSRRFICRRTDQVRYSVLVLTNKKYRHVFHSVFFLLPNRLAEAMKTRESRPLSPLCSVLASRPGPFPLTTPLERSQAQYLAWIATFIFGAQIFFLFPSPPAGGEDPSMEHGKGGSESNCPASNPRPPPPQWKLAPIRSRLPNTFSPNKSGPRFLCIYIVLT